MKKPILFCCFRRRKDNGNRSFIPINPFNIINEKTDISFKKNDKIKFFSIDEIESTNFNQVEVNNDYYDDNVTYKEKSYQEI